MGAAVSGIRENQRELKIWSQYANVESTGLYSSREEGVSSGSGGRLGVFEEGGGVVWDLE